MPKAKKQKNGKWRCQLYLGDKIVDGKRKQIIKSFTASTRAEAEDLAAAYRMEHGKRSVADMSVHEAMRRYIEAKGSVLSESTLRSYESQLRNYYDAISEIRIRDLTQEDVQRWLSEFSVDHSRATAKKAASFLNSSLRMFGAGFDASQITHKAEARKDVYVPTTDEVWALYDAADKADLKKAIMLAAFGGLRRGELCALTMEDIDFQKCTVRVTKDMIFTRNQDWVIKQMPKNDTSVRTVRMPGFALSPLRQGTISMTPGQLTNAFRKLSLRACGRSCGIHTLRHFFASQLHYAGIPQRTIERMGGWRPGSPVLAAIYQNSIADQEEAQALEAVKVFSDRHKKKSC